MQSHLDGEAISAQQATPDLADIEATAARLVCEHQVMSGRLKAMQAECNRLEAARRQQAALRYQAQCAQTALELHLARVCAELELLKGSTEAVPA